MLDLFSSQDYDFKYLKILINEIYLRRYMCKTIPIEKNLVYCCCDLISFMNGEF